MLRKLLILLICLCPLLAIAQARVVYYQDFGGNDVSDTVISQNPVPECLYMQNTDNSSSSGSYAVRKEGFFNGHNGVSQWYRQSDHTHDGDYSRGYFLQVDGGLERNIFYTFVVNNLPSDATVTVTLWVVNCYCAWQKQAFEAEHWPVQDPDIDLLITTANNHEVARFRIGPVAVDAELQGKSDFECSARWHPYSFSFTVPANEPTLRFSLGNRGIGSPGNDFGIDDITVSVSR